MARRTSKAKRLKVYGAAIGFFDVVVTAANQGEALKAWGVRQNLFAEGAAHVVEDKAVVAAAEARPGKVLRRPLGSEAAFEREPDAIAGIPAGRAPQSRQPSIGTKPARRARNSRTVRSSAGRSESEKAAAAALETAQTTLGAVEADWARDEAELAAARAALDEKVSAAKSDYSARRKNARTAVAAARRLLHGADS